MLTSEKNRRRNVYPELLASIETIINCLKEEIVRPRMDCLPHDVAFGIRLEMDIPLQISNYGSFFASYVTPPTTPTPRSTSPRSFL